MKNTNKKIARLAFTGEVTEKTRTKPSNMIAKKLNK